MRNILNLLNKGLQPLVAILLLFFISCTSCTATPSTKTDADIAVDKDITVDIDSEIQDTESDKTDEKMDENEDEYLPPDIDYIITVDSDDPYAQYDEEVAYTYYGDYDVTAQDPENVKSLWYKLARRCEPAVECEPKPYDICAQNYPFEPLLVEDDKYWNSNCGKKAFALRSNSYDRFLMHGCWDMDWLTFRPEFSFKNGKVFYYMHSLGTSGSVTYDVETKQVIRYGRGWRTGIGGDYLFWHTTDTSKNSWEKSCDNYTPLQSYLVYYDTKNNRYGYAYYNDFTHGSSFVVGDTHMIMTVQPNDNSDKLEVYVTKIGEWRKWRHLTVGLDSYASALFPSFKNQYLAYYASSGNEYTGLYLKAYFCDLSVTDLSNGCFQVSKDDEIARYPVVKDRNLVYYSIDLPDIDTTDKKVPKAIIEADISDPQHIKYKEILRADDKMAPESITDEFLIYTKVYGRTDGGSLNNGICFYRFKDQKSFCMKDGVDADVSEYFARMWKHYLVFQSFDDLIVRDMNGYCKENPTNCPFE